MNLAQLSLLDGLVVAGEPDRRPPRWLAWTDLLPRWTVRALFLCYPLEACALSVVLLVIGNIWLVGVVDVVVLTLIAVLWLACVWWLLLVARLWQSLCRVGTSRFQDFPQRHWWYVYGYVPGGWRNAYRRTLARKRVTIEQAIAREQVMLTNRETWEAKRHRKELGQAGWWQEQAAALAERNAQEAGETTSRLLELERLGAIDGTWRGEVIAPRKDPSVPRRRWLRW